MNCKQKKLWVRLTAVLLAIAGWLGVRMYLNRYIPAADQSDIGQTVMVSLPELLAVNPYGGSLNPESMDHLSFVYVYDSQEGNGRLTLFTRCADARYCCVTVYEPEWVGGEGLCSNLTGSFQGKVISRKNITAKEGFLQVHNITRYTDGTATFVHPESYRELQSSGLLWYMGVLDPTPQSSQWDVLDEKAYVSLKVEYEGDHVNALIDILRKYKLYEAAVPEM